MKKRNAKRKKYTGPPLFTRPSASKYFHEQIAPKKNPVVRGRMYKVAGDRNVKGIRLNKNGTTDILFVPDKNARNPYFNVAGRSVKAKSMRAALKKALKSNSRRRNGASKTK